MVDAAQNALIFCDVFVDRFHPADKTFDERLIALNASIRTLIVKHPLGRDEEILKSLRSELAGGETKSCDTKDDDS